MQGYLLIVFRLSILTARDKNLDHLAMWHFEGLEKPFTSFSTRSERPTLGDPRKASMTPQHPTSRKRSNMTME